MRRQSIRQSIKILYNFNPRTRAGCDFTAVLRVIFFGHFNPRTRAGCDKQQYHDFFTYSLISIHAPVLGATRSVTIVRNSLLVFQSTHPCWVRPVCCLCDDIFSIISIHAPVLGATNISNKKLLNIIISIHAPVLGATFGQALFIIAADEFQSTHPCWVRLPDGATSSNQHSTFQSTHPCWVRRKFHH